MSAIDKAVLVKEAIDDFKRGRESEQPDARVNLGLFRSGVHPAVVPGEAELALNIVYTKKDALDAMESGKNWSGASVMADFESAVRSRAQDDPWLAEHAPTIRWDKDLEPFETSLDAEIVAVIEKAFRDVLGENVSTSFLSAWCDAAWLSRKGAMDSVMFGAAAAGKAHTDDEYVIVEDMRRCAGVLGVALARLLTR